MKITPTIKEIIEQKIEEIKDEYQKTQGLILTEGDLKCIIFSKLFALPEFAEKARTKDFDICAIPIHSELSWYGEEDKLSIKPDITILDPENLSIIHGLNGVPFPSKSCHFVGHAIIFEIKFIRDKTGITPTIFQGPIMNDFNKIKGLFDRLSMQDGVKDTFCYFIIFNKTNKTCEEFDDFINRGQYNLPYSDYFKYIYVTGNVDFNYTEQSL